MTVAYFCIVLAMILPLLFAGLAKSDFKKFDNRKPRTYLANVEGWRQRAHWAQQNGFEIFAPFAVGVVVAHLTQGRQSLVDILAVVFVFSRVLYGVAYIVNNSKLRSLFWLIGFLSVIGLYFSSYF